MQITIRPESFDDHPSVFSLNQRAFGTDAEARLVENLRKVVKPLISLVAVDDTSVVGHILFSPVAVNCNAVKRNTMGLGPMAVLPAFQRRAIGSKLIWAGLDACRLENTDVVFVLGHKEYYPRFGFEPVVIYGLHYREPKLDTYFFVMELKPGMLAGLSGNVSYHPLFETV